MATIHHDALPSARATGQLIIVEVSGVEIFGSAGASRHAGPTAVVNLTPGGHRRQCFCAAGIQGEGSRKKWPKRLRVPFFLSEGRFVVLRHEMPAEGERPTHWDFMLETPSGLRTWALERSQPTEIRSRPEALPDHRAEYLTYEGPVSGDRGAVTQWDAGNFRWQRKRRGRSGGATVGQAIARLGVSGPPAGKRPTLVVCVFRRLGLKVAAAVSERLRISERSAASGPVSAAARSGWRCRLARLVGRAFGLPVGDWCVFVVGRHYRRLGVSRSRRANDSGEGGSVRPAIKISPSRSSIASSCKRPSSSTLCDR